MQQHRNRVEPLCCTVSSVLTRISEVSLRECIHVPGLMISVRTLTQKEMKSALAFDRKLVVLVGRLSILTGFCPLSCCYHKLCVRICTYVYACTCTCVW